LVQTGKQHWHGIARADISDNSTHKVSSEFDKEPPPKFRAHASTAGFFQSAHERNAQAQIVCNPQRLLFSVLLKGQTLLLCPRDRSRGVVAGSLLEGKGDRVWPTRRASADLSIFFRPALALGQESEINSILR
jgi:hypothetical protein